ncbi:MAG TPA: ABC transporter permease [Gaiellaceae bacterium]|nr:ABC transporter permease [Gaiellaceae bacterium]
MNNLRLLTVGGVISYRALFGWLNPVSYVVTMLIPSITKLAFFVFLGRAAHVEDDSYYVVGNALVAAASPSLFGMAQTIAGERYTSTLALLVISPANRVALFLGRSLPATANGIVISVWTFVLASLIFGISVPGSAVAPLALTILVSSFSCVGLGLFNGSLGLRWRETGVLGNVLLYILLLFAGINIPLDRLPGWMGTLAQGLPLTHGARAARELVGGASFTHVLPLIAAEALVGVVYTVIGLSTIRYFEIEARRGATLEVA